MVTVSTPATSVINALHSACSATPRATASTVFSRCTCQPLILANSVLIPALPVTPLPTVSLALLTITCHRLAPAPTVVLVAWPATPLHTVLHATLVTIYSRTPALSVAAIAENAHLLPVTLAKPRTHFTTAAHAIHVAKSCPTANCAATLTALSVHHNSTSLIIPANFAVKGAPPVLLPFFVLLAFPLTTCSLGLACSAAATASLALRPLLLHACLASKATT